MRVRTIEISVGLFLVAGLLALAMLALKVSGLSVSAGGGTYRLYAEFDNVGALTRRAKVSMAGVTVGRVVDIEFDKNTYMARVAMDLDADVNTIPLDSSAAILTTGLLGEKFVGISAGGDDVFLKDGDLVEDTQSAVVLEELIGRFLLNSSDGGD
ncbi:MAG: outer membrane lipid asymmetry maintenance protein MlaD [Kistimonas sp.]|nr:outer membrane lipid asymmetry maintenance protein MlaD [Kistimonas sp.]